MIFPTNTQRTKLMAKNHFCSSMHEICCCFRCKSIFLSVFRLLIKYQIGLVQWNVLPCYFRWGTWGFFYFRQFIELLLLECLRTPLHARFWWYALKLVQSTCTLKIAKLSIIFTCADSNIRIYREAHIVNNFLKLQKMHTST